MRAFLAVFTLAGFTFACYNAETVTAMFGKEQKDICNSENCKNDEISQANVHTEKSELPMNEKSPSIKIEDTSSRNTPEKHTDPEAINLIITFTNAADNPRLQEKFTLTVSSLLKHATVPLSIHVIGDDRSQSIASRILRKSAQHAKSTYSMVRLDVDRLASQLHAVVLPMQDHFSYRTGAYYNHALFFLSIAIHKVMPDNMQKVIMIDCDLKFRADIRLLYERFDLFTEETIMGIGRDLQPVYRHTFSSYRSQHPDTRVGEPPPHGLTGFNSGVLLLDLNRMRDSQLYNSLLNREALEKLTKEFAFKGHLGDQDFFSLLSMKYERLFHVLPCTWNRQLCTWWRDKGYEAVFDKYFNCEGEVNIYHGNCDTPIPED